jgi:phosphomannomutase/phosphoglucomutase
MSQASYEIPKNPAKEIFRAYDIRGIVGDSFNDNTVYAVGRALGALATAQKQQALYLGYDARPSSPGFKEAMTAGLMDSGIDVIDIGIVPSPVLYYATHVGDTHSGVMITGSHNPSDYNGIKMVMGGCTLSSTAIAQLYQAILQQDFVSGEGHIKQEDMIDRYIDDIVERVHLDRPLKVVVDCGNGVAALTAAKLYRKIGAEVIELYGELDGTFPNHHPDPSIPENLQDLIHAIKAHKADCGLAFDGDADRVGLVTETGEIIWPDRMMMLLAQDVLTRHPNAPIVFDIKCSHLLAEVIKQQGGQPIMAKTGHSLIKGEMKKYQAPLAGELSGHIFYQDGWYGFDDGVYVGARLLQIIAQSNDPASQLFANFPMWKQTPELKVQCKEDNKFHLVDNLIKHFKKTNKDGEVVTIDGLRINYNNGWFLVRASNTTPCLTVRFEGKTWEHLKNMAKEVKQSLLALDDTLTIEFEAAISAIIEGEI